MYVYLQTAHWLVGVGRNFYVQLQAGGLSWQAAAVTEAAAWGMGHGTEAHEASNITVERTQPQLIAVLHAAYSEPMRQTEADDRRQEQTTTHMADLE